VSAPETRAMFDELLPADAAEPTRPQISFGAFWAAYQRELRRLGLMLLVVLPVVFVLAVLGVHLFSGQSYTAEMTVAPNRIVNSASQSANGGSISSLIGLQGVTDTQFDLYLSTRDSNLLAAKLMAKPGIPQQIFYYLWDKDRHQWRPPVDLFSGFRRGVSSVLGFPSWAPPDTGDVADYLSKNIKVAADKRTLITHIEFSYRNPEFAKALLLAVHEEAEALLREQAQRHTRVMIAHIVHELGTVTVTEQREALIQLLSQQEKELMMIGDNLPYAAVVVDPPSVDSAKGKPRPLLMVFFALLVAAIACASLIGWQVLRDMKKSNRRMADADDGAEMQHQSYLEREV
jgi:uncharacterized protein involved in exopolysaccharide biosynthesis